MVVIGGLGSMSGALIGRVAGRLDPRRVARHLSRVRDPGHLSDRDRCAAVQAIRAARKAGHVMRGNDAHSRCRGRRGARRWCRCWRRRSTPTCWSRSSAMPSRLLGFNLLFGYAGLLSFGHAMFLGARRLWGGSASPACSASGTSRSCCWASALGAVVVARAGRPPVRALHRHLLRHADAGVRHADALVPVQVLPPHRRRQRHARAAHDNPGAGIRRPTTRSSCWRARSTTIAWRCW